ncbi:MAG: hypothetical protein ABIJ00_03815 [Candidatus Eisenbacteria bacterium]
MAQAIAEGKVQVTVADLDRLIGPEEFLREEARKSEGIKVVFSGTDTNGRGNEIQGREDASTTSAEEAD